MWRLNRLRKRPWRLDEFAPRCRSTAKEPARRTGGLTPAARRYLRPGCVHLGVFENPEVDQVEQRLQVDLAEKLIVSALEELFVADRSLADQLDDVGGVKGANHHFQSAVLGACGAAADQGNVVAADAGAPTGLSHDRFKAKPGDVVGQFPQTGLDLLGELQTAARMLAVELLVRQLAVGLEPLFAARVFAPRLRARSNRFSKSISLPAEKEAIVDFRGAQAFFRLAKFEYRPRQLHP